MDTGVNDSNSPNYVVDRKTGVVSARENILRNTKLTIKYAENMKKWGQKVLYTGWYQ